MRYFWLLAIVLLLPACRSGAILEGDKPNYSSSDKQVWADSDYKTENDNLTASSQVVMSTPNIRIEPQNVAGQTNIINVPQAQYQVPLAPQMPTEISRQLYTVLGSRTINRMLNDTSNLYKDGKPNLFIAYPVTNTKSVVLSSPEYAEIIAEDIIVGSNSYNIIHSADQADYTLYTYISDASSNIGKPIIVYRITLKDRQNNQIGTWAESVSQIANDDKSWW